MTTPRTTQGGSRPPFKRGGRRRRQCYCKESTVDYKDVSSIRRFITDRGRIEAGKKSGNCAKCQRNLTTAIKRARHLALLPYAPDHLRVTGTVATNNRIADDEEETVDGEATESTATESSDGKAPVAETESSETPAAGTEDAAEDEPEAVEEAETEDAAEDEPEAIEEAESEEADTTTGDVSTGEAAEAEEATGADASTDEEDK